MALPFVAPKVASTVPIRIVPEDLEPDPEPTPDEPGPANPIL